MEKLEEKQIHKKMADQFSKQIEGLEKWEDHNPSLVLFMEKNCYFSVKNSQNLKKSDPIHQLTSLIESFIQVFDTKSAKGVYKIRNPKFRANDLHCEEKEFIEIKVNEQSMKKQKFENLSSDSLLFRLMTFIQNKEIKFEDLIYKTKAFEGKGYEITLDNFMKMALIIQRTRLRLPVICMGETGCGKTYMIKYISKVLLNTHQFIHLTLHAGYTETQLQQFLISNEI
jgi:hypothetical protein